MKNVQLHIFPGIQHGYMMRGNSKAFDSTTYDFSMAARSRSWKVCARPRMNRGQLLRHDQVRQLLRVAEELGARPVVGDAAAVEDQRGVGDRERQLGVLLDQDDRERVLAR